MNIENMASKLAGKIPVNIDRLPVSDPVKPIEKETQAAAILSEMEERCGFDRSEPSMEYKGSERNEEFVRQAIEKKYGAEEAGIYEPCVQVKPRTEWLKHGYVVCENEEPLCFILTRHGNQNMVPVAMWHLKQVERK